MSNDCFFYIDYSDPKQRIWALCKEHGSQRKDTWFWNKGFGKAKWEVRCKECNKLIWPGYENLNNDADSRQP